MNLVILIDSAQMFFRNFGLRHAKAAFGDFAIGLAGPKAGRMIIALFARPVEWLRSRLRPQVPETSIVASLIDIGSIGLLAEISTSCAL